MERLIEPAPPAGAEAPAPTTCALCGFRFDPGAHLACAGCPLNPACLLTCCPRCGYSTADPTGSALVGLFGRVARRRRRRGGRTAGQLALSELEPGATAAVVEIGAAAAAWREQLQAYGLAPGRELEVIQQRPVTVVRVERTELAFEARIARGIVVRERRAT